MQPQVPQHTLGGYIMARNRTILALLSLTLTACSTPTEPVWRCVPVPLEPVAPEPPPVPTVTICVVQ